MEKTFGEKMEPMLLELERHFARYGVEAVVPPEFTKDGFRAILKIFTDGFLDRMFAKQERENMSDLKRAQMISYFIAELSKIIEQATDIKLILSKPPL